MKKYIGQYFKFPKKRFKINKMYLINLCRLDTLNFVYAYDNFEILKNNTERARRKQGKEVNDDLANLQKDVVMEHRIYVKLAASDEHLKHHTREVSLKQKIISIVHYHIVYLYKSVEL